MIETLVRMAEDEGIAIIGSNLLGFDLSESLPAVSYEDYRTIVIKPEINGEEYANVLAHELGHFYTAAFYNPSTPLQTKGICESKANAWAVQQICPLANLKASIQAGNRTYWEIAEALGVTESTVRTALSYYQRKRML